MNRNENAVPLCYQNSGGTTERVGSGRAAARHTLRKGSERDAERVGATCAKPRDNLPSEWRYHHATAGGLHPDPGQCEAFGLHRSAG